MAENPGDLENTLLAVNNPATTDLATRSELFANMVSSLDAAREKDLSDNPEALPHQLLQITAFQGASWYHTARILAGIRQTHIWEKVDDGAYAGNFPAFLKRYTKGTQYSEAWAKRMLGYYDWIEENYGAISESKPTDCKNNTIRIPRQSIMKFIFQYRDAFAGSSRLLGEVFWNWNSDESSLLAIILEQSGPEYIAEHQPPAVRSSDADAEVAGPLTDRIARDDNGRQRPEYSTVSTRPVDFNPNYAALEAAGDGFSFLLATVYNKLGDAEKARIRGLVEDIARRVLETDGDLRRYND